MHKKQVIASLKGIIKNIELDCREEIDGVKIMISEGNWRLKAKNDANLLIDWGKKQKVEGLRPTINNNL